MPHKLLKVLTGPHQGAEIELPPGAITLGSGADTDVILDDHTVGEQHIEIADHGEAGVRVHFFKSGFIDTRPVESGNEVDLADFEVVSLGTTSICVGPAGEPWPTVRVPDWAKLAEQIAPEPEPREGAASDTGNDEIAAGDSGSTGESLAPAIPDAAALPEAAPAPSSEGRGRKTIGIVLLCGLVGLLSAVAILVLGLGLGASNSNSPTSNAATPPPDLAATVGAISTEYGLELEQQEDVYVLSGLVQTSQTRDELTRRVFPLEPYVRCEVYTPDQIKTAADAVLRGFEFAVTATCTDQGVLRLHGWAPSEDAWKRALVRLRDDVPGVVSFEEEVGFLSNVSAQLAADLEKAGLTDVRLTLNKGRLSCRGGVPEDRMREWKSLLSAWKSEIPAIDTVVDETVPIVAAVVPEDADDPAAAVAKVTGLALPGPVISATLDPVPCFRTSDGSVFFLGARLSDGYVVDVITSTGITFTRGDSDVREYSLVDTNAAEMVDLAMPAEVQEIDDQPGT